MKFPTTNNRMAVNTGTPAAKDQYQNGVRLESDESAVFVTTSTVGATASDGFLLSPDGALVTVDAPAALPAGATWCNGLPLASNGAVCTSTAAPAYWANGLPFTSFGAISIGQDSADLAFAVLAKYGANANLWLPGVGVISGVTAKNWQDTGGTVAAQENLFVALVANNSGGTATLTQATGAAQPKLIIDANGKWCWQMDGSVDYFNVSSVLLQMTDDYTVIAGASLTTAGTSRAIFAQSNASNHALPEFLFDQNGRLGIYALGGGATVGAYDTVNSVGAGPVVATLDVKSSVARVRKNGTQVATVTFSGTYATATTAAVGAFPTIGVIERFPGNIYPVILIKATVPDADIQVLEHFVGTLSGAAI